MAPFACSWDGLQEDPVDVVARLVQAELSKQLGTPVIVENRPGASGMLATDAMLSQPRDGRTLLVCTHYETMNPIMYRSAKFKVTDLAGISLLARYYTVMTTSEKSSFKSVGDVVAFAKENPGKLTYGTTGPGSTQDMLMRQLADLSGSSMQSVVFRGAVPALTEVIAGRLDVFISPSGPAIPLAESGQIRLLATTSAERLSVAAEVPTFIELGYPLKLYGWVGICAASGTPAPIIERLGRELASIGRSPEYRAKIQSTGQIPEGSSPTELQETLGRMTDEISQLTSKYGIRVD